MNTSTIREPLTLFGSAEPAATVEPPALPAPQLGLVPAAARLVTTNFPDTNDPELRRKLLLVVDCPFCGGQHIHPGGYEGSPRVCPRRARCVGQPGGSYYFPAVHQ